MKRSELIMAVILVPLDFLAILAAASTAFQIRRLEFVTGIRPVLFDLSLETYLGSAALIALIWLCIFAAAGLYRIRSTDTILTFIGRIFFACGMGFVAITVLVFLRGELFNSRFVILAGTVLAVVYVTTVRLLTRFVARLLFRQGYMAHRVVIVGSGVEADTMENNMRLQPELGYRVIDRIVPGEPGLAILTRLAGADALDEIMFVDAGTTPEQRQAFLEFAEDNHVGFRYAPDILVSPIIGPSIHFDLGMPVIELPETRLVGWGRVLKRSVDIVGSILAIIIFSPIIVLVGLFIFLETGRPILYVSQRIGRNRSFVFYKFRSMKQEFCTGEQYGGKAAEEYEARLIATQNTRNGPVPKISDDPRFTKVGRVIRRLSLDELPQFINVLRGDMSLVGPRPHLPREVAAYERHHKKVLAIKPGMTGLAQVSGRSDLDFDEEVRLDRYYIEHWSAWLDLTIFLKTITAVLGQRRAL